MHVVSDSALSAICGWETGGLPVPANRLAELDALWTAAHMSGIKDIRQALGCPSGFRAVPSSCGPHAEAGIRCRKQVPEYVRLALLQAAGLCPDEDA